MRRYYVLACAAILCALPLLAGARPLPVKKWVRFPEFRNVIISPDGTYLAVVSSPKDSDQYQLAVFKTAQVLAGHPKITAHIGLREYEKFAGVRWINDKRLIAWTARQFGGFDRPSLDGDLYAVNATGSQMKHLMGQHGGGQLGYRTSGTNQMVFFGGLLATMPQQKNIILVQGYNPGSAVPAAYRLDTLSDVFHRVTTGIYGGSMMADHNGVVRLAWGTNQKTGQIEVKYRKAGSMNWKNVTSRVITNKTAAAAQALGGAIMFTPGNAAIYFTAWSENAKRTKGLYRLDLNSGKFKLLYVNKSVDVGIGDFPDTTPFITSFDNRSLVGLRVMPGKIDTEALNVKAPRIQLLAGLQRAFPGKDVEIVSHTRSGNECVVKVWGDATPAKYYLYSSRPKPSVVAMFSETPWIKARDLSPMRPITYQSRDGLTIHGYLTVPRGRKAKNLPLVVYIHGGPHGIRYDWGFSAADFDLEATQILANHGFAVLAPNYRGSGGYGYKFESAGYGHWGNTMQNDVDDAVKWAIKQGIANPQRICILGASYGGYAALMSSERFPDVFKCAVGYDGAYDLTVEESRDSDTGRSASGRLYMRTVLGTNKKQLKRFSPVYNVRTLKAAVLLLHGGRDERTPVKGYEEMVHAIRKHGTPLETLFEKNEGHGFYKPAHRRKAWKTILAFLDKYIGPGAAPDSANGTAAGKP